MQFDGLKMVYDCYFFMTAVATVMMGFLAPGQGLPLNSSEPLAIVEVARVPGKTFYRDAAATLLRFSDFVTFCQINYLSPATVETPDEQRVIEDYYMATNFPQAFWLGLWDFNHEGVFRWWDTCTSTSETYDNMMRQSVGPEYNFVAMRNDDYKWQDVYAAFSGAVPLCQRRGSNDDVGNMDTINGEPGVLEFNKNSFTEHPSMEKPFQLQMKEIPCGGPKNYYHDALNRNVFIEDYLTLCQLNGMQTASILNAEDQACLANYVTANNYAFHLWLGLWDSGTESTFRWMDGCQVMTFENFDVGEGIGGTGENFAIFKYDTKKWADVFSIFSGAVALCQIDTSTPVPTVGPTTEQLTTEPDTTEPDTTEPATTVPDTTELGSTEPDTTEPDTTEPNTTEADTTEPATTVPDTTELGTTEPDTTEPDFTESGTTVPDTTELGTTESDTTEPNATESDTTEPDTTESGTTDSTTQSGIRTTTELDDTYFTCPAGEASYPHPETCTHYILCAAGQRYIVPCLEGSLYNPKLPGCTRADLYMCDLTCEGKSDGQHQHPYNCSLFFECHDGELILGKCSDDPIELWFHKGKNECWLASDPDCVVME